MSNSHQNFPEPPEHEIVRQNYPAPSQQTVDEFRDKMEADHAPVQVEEQAIITLGPGTYTLDKPVTLRQGTTIEGVHPHPEKDPASK
jgi:hypothetical protein